MRPTPPDVAFSVCMRARVRCVAVELRFHLLGSPTSRHRRLVYEALYEAELLECEALELSY
jgi:hypothetical protein